MFGKHVRTHNNNNTFEIISFGFHKYFNYYLLPRITFITLYIFYFYSSNINEAIYIKRKWLLFNETRGLSNTATFMDFIL